MAALPPPPTPAGRREPAEDRAARLERLAQRTRPATRSLPDRDATGTARRPRRNHPAKGARTAALGMSLMTTAGLAGVFALTNRPPSGEAAAAVIVSDAAGAPVRATSVTSPSTATPAPAADGGEGAAASAPPAAQQTVVDGAVFRNRWGPVQVEATFAGDGTLTDVVALQTPNDRGRSISINNYAVPRLTSEALTAQSASVQSVSGATYTSDGYRQSLQSAIDAARTAGVTSIA